ncbi:MAG: flagellar basal-body rod protein FlgF [Desulfopila sp.]
MVSGKYSALSGAITRQQSINNISANLANVTTVGYKKKGMSFESMLEGAKQIEATKGINYNRVRGNYADLSQGPLKETGNTFDLAINGEGFFKIRGAEQDLLTRKGNFVLGNDGRLLSDKGRPVIDEGGAEIFIPQGDTARVSIDSAGTISTIDSTGEVTEVGRVAVVNVEDPTTLKMEAETAYSLPDGAVELPAENFSIAQGRVEVSNVNMTEEMTRMINDNRLYTTYHNVLESYSKLGENLSDLGTLA